MISRSTIPRPHERIRSQPFFDAVCRKLKREVWHLGRRVGWRGEVFKALERKYHALVRRKRRSYQFQRACQTLEHMKSQPKKFWASFQDAPERLPQALRNVRAWDSFVQSLAGSPRMVSSPANPRHEAYPITALWLILKNSLLLFHAMRLRSPSIQCRMGAPRVC
jgi:hypothetical protein